MPARYVVAISGHSTRVGATQDLAALGIDLAAITTGRRVEIGAHAVAVCGEDQCGKIRNGEGGTEGGEGPVVARPRRSALPSVESLLWIAAWVRQPSYKESGQVSARQRTRCPSLSIARLSDYHLLECAKRMHKGCGG